MKRGESAARGGDPGGEGIGICLLGATVIAVPAFAAIGTLQDSIGEFCRSLSRWSRLAAAQAG